MRKKNFEPTFTDRLLLFLADAIDFNLAARTFNKSFAYFAGDPNLRKHRQWLENIIKSKKEKQKFISTLHSLESRKFIKYINKGGSKGLIFLEKGEKKLLKINNKTHKRKKFLNGEWIMVFFDIPEKQKNKRNALRRRLKDLEFQQLQKSIWITQYDIVDFLKKELKELGVSDFVKFLIVKEPHNT